jgi:AcrR family transcriptional regulator
MATMVYHTIAGAAGSPGGCMTMPSAAISRNETLAVSRRSDHRRITAVGVHCPTRDDCGSTRPPKSCNSNNDCCDKMKTSKLNLTAPSQASAIAEPPATRRRGRPVGDREARSGELVAAARAVIAREGYGGASLRKVAEQAGASTGAVSYYFDNKEAMVVAVAENLFDEFDAWLEAQGGAYDPQSLCNSMLNWSTRGAGEAYLICLQLTVGARSDPALAVVMARRNAQFLTNLTKLLEKGQAEGLIRRDFPADILADQFSAMADGWALTYPLEPARFSQGRIRHLVDSAAALLSPP